MRSFRFIFIDPNNGWKVNSSRTLVGRSGVDYACIEPAGTALYLSSDDPYYFSFDSENAVKYRERQEKPEATTARPDTESKL